MIESGRDHEGENTKKVEKSHYRSKQTLRVPAG
jgi:hypothetical protein